MFASNAPCRAVTPDNAFAVDILVGCRIWSLRHEKGMSLERLADAVDVSYRTMAEYENGRLRMDATALYDITRVLGVRPADVFGG